MIFWFNKNVFAIEKVAFTLAILHSLELFRIYFIILKISIVESHYCCAISFVSEGDSIDGGGGAGGGSSKNITQTLSNTAVQQASGGSKNVNQVIRQAAQILANRAGVSVEKAKAVIIQMAIQMSQAQGKSIIGDLYLF